jgi:hypothetical protein
MSSRHLRFGAMLVLVAAALALVVSGALAQPDARGGKGKGKSRGTEKVTICHKGKKSIRVGAPALKGHLRHGDTAGACFAKPMVTPGPNQAVLVVFKYVTNDSGGTMAPSDFTITVNGVSVIGGSSFPGSAAGTAKVVLGGGSYSVTESAVPGYTLWSASAGCAGTIAPGQEKTCLLVSRMPWSWCL